MRVRMGPTWKLGTLLEPRPQAKPPLNHHGKEFANNNGLLMPLVIDKGGKEPQQARKGGGIELFIPLRGICFLWIQT